MARYLSSQTKAQIDDMVTQIRLALSERLERIAWISRKNQGKSIEQTLSPDRSRGDIRKCGRDYSRLEIKVVNCSVAYKTEGCSVGRGRVTCLGLTGSFIELNTTPDNDKQRLQLQPQ